MVRRERLETCGEVADLDRRPGNAEPAAVVLKHIDARAAVGCVNHYIDSPGGLEHLAQRPKTCVGVGQMVQHAGADYVFEASPEVRRAVHGELAYLQVVEGVPVLQGLRERDTFGADVDPDDLGARPAQRVMGGLCGAAAGDQYAAVVAIGLV